MHTRLPRYWRRLGAVVTAVIVAVVTLSCNSSEPEEDKASNGEGEGSGTSPQEPYPAGSEVEVADWTVTLSNLRFDVTEEVLESDPYGYAIGPSSGNQFSMFTIEGTYNGAGSSALWLEFSFGMWADGAFYLPCPATTPDDIYMTPEVSSGNTVSGTVCIEIPTDVDEVVPYLEQVDGEQTRTFIVIDADAPEEVPTVGTSSEAPLPAGSRAAIGNWTITPSNLQLDTVSEGDLDLWGELPPDRQIVFYDVEGAYSGTGIASLSLDVEVGIWTEGAFYPEGCEATLPGYWAEAPDVEEGGTASGTACAEIPDDITDTADLLFYVSAAEDLGGPIYYVEVD